MYHLQTCLIVVAELPNSKECKLNNPRNFSIYILEKFTVFEKFTELSGTLNYITKQGFHFCSVFLKVQFVAKYQKIEGGPFGAKKNFEKSRTVLKKFKGRTLQSRPVLYLSLKME